MRPNRFSSLLAAAAACMVGLRTASSLGIQTNAAPRAGSARNLDGWAERVRPTRKRRLLPEELTVRRTKRRERDAARAYRGFQADMNNPTVKQAQIDTRHYI